MPAYSSIKRHRATPTTHLPHSPSGRARPTTRLMQSSEAFAAGDVVVVPFPYTDRLAEKRRPALVISSARLVRFGVVWIAMITSAENEPWACDVRIADIDRAGLPAASVIRPA